MAFTSEQRAAIEAATARIIPADRDPGAREAGVVDYIERTLATYDKHAAQLYLDGVRELDELARSQFSAAAFSSLRPEQQDQVLALLEEKKSRFFSLSSSSTQWKGSTAILATGETRIAWAGASSGFPAPASRTAIARPWVGTTPMFLTTFLRRRNNLP